MELIKRFLKEEEGATMVEYALMLALIAIICIGAVTLIGQNASGVFSNVDLSLSLGS